MQSLDINSFMRRGQQYTISLKSSGWYRPQLDTVTTELQFIPNISQIQIKLVGGVYGFFADQFDITFTYTGDGSDVIAVVAQAMLTAMSVDLANFDYVGAYTGDTGTPPEGSPGGGGPQLPTLPGTGTIALIVIGLALVVFLASGGATLVRRSSGA